MREFYLTNNLGDTFKFGYRSGVLVSSVDNIGFTKEVSYTDFDSTYKKSYEKNPIQDINLSLTFLTGYRGYKNFVDFIESSSYFYFYYKSVEFKYCYCEIESLTKSELTFGALQSNLLIKRLSYWYKDVVKEICDESNVDLKSYPYKYPYKYRESMSGEIQLTNNGYSRAPLRIIIKGAFENPEVNVYREGKKVSTMRILYKTDDGMLLLNSFPTDQRIEIRDKGEKIDAYKFQDFGVENFLFLERGSHILEIKANVSKPPTCTVVMTEGYLSN